MRMKKLIVVHSDTYRALVRAIQDIMCVAGGDCPNLKELLHDLDGAMDIPEGMKVTLKPPMSTAQMRQAIDRTKRKSPLDRQPVVKPIAAKKSIKEVMGKMKMAFDVDQDQLHAFGKMMNRQKRISEIARLERHRAARGVKKAKAQRPVKDTGIKIKTEEVEDPIMGSQTEVLKITALPWKKLPVEYLTGGECVWLSGKDLYCLSGEPGDTAKPLLKVGSKYPPFKVNRAYRFIQRCGDRLHAINKAKAAKLEAIRTKDCDCPFCKHRI